MGNQRALVVGILLSSALLLGLGAPRASAITCTLPSFCGTIYYTQFSGAFGKVDFTYNPTTPLFSPGSPTTLCSDPSHVSCLPGGADGLVFDPQLSNTVLIGSNTGATFYQVLGTSGTLVTTKAAGTSTPFHMMVDPLGTTAWTSGIPGTPASIPLNPLAAGTGHPLSGDDSSIDTIIWTDQSHAYYTESGAGGSGHFGTINLSTFVTSCVKDPTDSCHTFPAAHGGVYDPFTGDIFIFGDSHVTQINPTLPLSGCASSSSCSIVVGDYNAGSFCSQLDQGTVDGAGHVYVACNFGCLLFVDYASTKNVGTSSYSTCPFLASNLDDLAPIVGAGSPPPLGVPEFPVGLGAAIALAIPVLFLVRDMATRKRTSI